MIFGSVCSGIESASCAWDNLGWKARFFSEIEKFPSAVLKYRYPKVPNLGDMTKYKEWNYGQGSIDLMVGGTPCQSFSIAGLRKGLDDPRGNLTLVYLGLLAKFRPRWFVWENVPGVLSDCTGAFTAFQKGLAELGYFFSWRVLDAKYYGVPQRRRRVFVVGYLGDWRPPAAVLFERSSLSGDIEVREKAREGTSGEVASCLRSGGEGGIPSSRGENLIAGTLKRRDYKGIGFDDNDKLICFEPRSPDGHARISGDLSPTLNRMGGGQREPCICIQGAGERSLNVNGKGWKEDESFTLNKTENHAVAFKIRGGKEGGGKGYLGSEKESFTLSTLQDQNIYSNMQVRRFTPVECERLQGFPDNWTKIPYGKKTADECPDGSRYKAIGNSMAVPVMNWLGKRIQMVENILNK